jgi:hypothetical protein
MQPPVKRFSRIADLRQVDDPSPHSTPPPPGWADPVAGARGGASPPPEPVGRRRGIPTPLLVVIGAALIAAIGLLLTMPGGSSTTSTPLSPIAKAAERTAALPGGRFTGTGTGTFPDGSMTMAFDGVYNGTADRSRVDMNAQLTGATSLSMSMSAIQDGVVTYMASPLFGDQLPNGAHWLKLDLSEFGAGAFEGVGSAGAVNGRQILDSLRAVSADARAVGTERVRGVSTTEYAATIDAGLQAQQLRDAGVDDALADTVEQAGPSAVSVWIDDKGMVRRTDLSMPLAVPGQPPAQMSMSLEYYDFVITPDIQVPPEEDTFDATELSKLALESAGS